MDFCKRKAQLNQRTNFRAEVLTCAQAVEWLGRNTTITEANGAEWGEPLHRTRPLMEACQPRTPENGREETWRPHVFLATG
jgi:hypothetical protein